MKHINGIRIIVLAILALSGVAQVGYSQCRVYDWNFKKDGPALAGIVGAWAGSVYGITRSVRLTEADLAVLNPMDVNSLDRQAIFNENHTADVISDIGLMGSILVGFAPYLGDKCRSEEFAVLGMALETFFISNALTNVFKFGFKRVRPYAYLDDIPLERRLGVGAGFSFPSGHTSAAASFCFFSARVYSELYPKSKWKKVVWAGAILVPVITGYSRFSGGNHFPTDVIAGYALGAATGYLIPAMHKSSSENLGVSVTPFVGGLAVMIEF